MIIAELMIERRFQVNNNFSFFFFWILGIGEGINDGEMI
jgi:hypothetical protein